MLVTMTSHFNQNPINVFPEMKLRSLVPNFHIHVSVCDLYISTYFAAAK